MLLSYNDIKNYIDTSQIIINNDYEINNCGIDLAVHLNKQTIRIEPGEFLLLKTSNYLSLPNNLAAFLGGRSRYARKGLLIHCTSALIAPGFCGNIVLEVKNLGKDRITLRDKEKICSISFIKMLTEAPAYNGKYQGQHEV